MWAGDSHLPLRWRTLSMKSEATKRAPLASKARAVGNPSMGAPWPCRGRACRRHHHHTSSCCTGVVANPHLLHVRHPLPAVQSACRRVEHPQLLVARRGHKCPGNSSSRRLGRHGFLHRGSCDVTGEGGNGHDGVAAARRQLVLQSYVLSAGLACADSGCAHETGGRRDPPGLATVSGRDPVDATEGRCSIATVG